MTDAELCGASRREVLAPADRVETERLGAERDVAADRAEAGDADRLAEQALGLRVLAAFPLAEAERCDGVGDAPVEADREAEHELGDGRRVLAGAVGDVDAAFARGLHVDGRDLGAGADDEIELPRVLDRLPRHLLRANDEDADARDLGLECLLRDLRFVEDIDGEGSQLFDRARMELIGNENTHDVPRSLAEFVRGDEHLCAS